MGEGEGEGEVLVVKIRRGRERREAETRRGCFETVQYAQSSTNRKLAKRVRYAPNCALFIVIELDFGPYLIHNMKLERHPGQVRKLLKQCLKLLAADQGSVDFLSNLLICHFFCWNCLFIMYMVRLLSWEGGCLETAYHTVSRVFRANSRKRTFCVDLDLRWMISCWICLATTSIAKSVEEKKYVEDCCQDAQQWQCNDESEVCSR